MKFEVVEQDAMVGMIELEEAHKPLGLLLRRGLDIAYLDGWQVDGLGPATQAQTREQRREHVYSRRDACVFEAG